MGEIYRIEALVAAGADREYFADKEKLEGLAAADRIYIEIEGVGGNRPRLSG